MKKFLFFSFITILGFFPGLASSTWGAPSSPTERRIALVIGNGSYTNAPLKNPVNDASDMAAKLEACGFKVTKSLNADRAKMREVVREFEHQLRKGGVGLFFFAGHGIQVNGRNYLVPVGASIHEEYEIDDECLKVSSVLRAMEYAGNRLNIIVLDACRDNPFARSFRSSKSGLAKMDAPTGSLLAYATSPGSVASDGTGRNGIYTGRILELMQKPGLEVLSLFRLVRVGVMSDTGNKQVPWESTSLTGEFYFVPAQAEKDKPAAAAQENAPAAGGEEALVEVAAAAPPDATPIDLGASKGLTVKRTDKPARAGVPQDSLSAMDKAPALTGAVEEKQTAALSAKSRGEEDLSNKKKFTNSIGMEFVLIPPGAFKMGSPESERFRLKSEKAHDVKITIPYFLQTTEVTQKQWKEIMGYNPSYFKDCEDCPVENVTYHDVLQFLKKLNEKEGTEYYRLPTEAEWEFGGRADSDAAWFFGASPSRLEEFAWFHFNSKGKTNPVGAKRPNSLGLYDMSGNVYEWCLDWYGKYPETEEKDPLGPATGSNRVMRGGSWLDRPGFTRMGFRGMNIPNYRGNYIGFRVARDARPAKN